MFSIMDGICARRATCCAEPARGTARREPLKRKPRSARKFFFSNIGGCKFAYATARAPACRVRPRRRRPHGAARFQYRFVRDAECPSRRRPLQVRCRARAAAGRRADRGAHRPDAVVVDAGAPSDGRIRSGEPVSRGDDAHRRVRRCQRCVDRDRESICARARLRRLCAVSRQPGARLRGDACAGRAAAHCARLAGDERRGARVRA